MDTAEQIEISPRKGDFWFACVDIAVLRDPDLTPIDKTVFGVLCSFASANTRDAWTKISTIAKSANCSERAVIRSLKILSERGIIKKQARFVDGKQISSIYYIIGYHAYADANKISTDTESQRHDSQSPIGVTHSHTELEPKRELEPKDIPPISPKEEETVEGDIQEQEPPEDIPTKSVNPIDEWFSKFWQHYPKKVDKKRAYRTFKGIFSRASPDKQRQRMENLILRLTKYIADRKGEDPKYTKNPQTWLNSYDFNEVPGDDEVLYKDVWKEE